jgi:hypothetical protein
VKTIEGVALVKKVPFTRDLGLPLHLDRREQEVIAPGFRPNQHRVREFRALIVERKKDSTKA